MGQFRQIVSLVGAAAVSSGALCAVSLAEDPAAPAPLVEVYVAGLDAIEPAPQDAAAFEALQLLGERLVELPEEFDGDPEAAGMIALAWDLFSGGLALQVMPSDEQPGVAVGLTSRPGDGQTPAGFAETLAGMLEAQGAPIERDADGSAQIFTPVGPARLTLTDTASGPATALTYGPIAPPELAVPRFGLPEGATPILAMRLDMPGLSNFLVPLIDMQEPGAAEALVETGWIGPDAPTVEFAMGAHDEHIRAVTRLRGARAAMARSGITPDVAFESEHFRAVPFDAVRVVATPFSIDPLLSMIDQAALEQGQDDVFAEVDEALGIDTRRDVLRNLGPRILGYQSDATGGGGLLSTVVIAELSDPDGFARAVRSAAARLNAFAADEANGYVHARSFEIAGRPAFSFTTPGLPIPIEPAIALTDRSVVLAATPGALEVALAHLADPARSVLDNPTFARDLKPELDSGAVSTLAYMDTARLARNGYGITSLLMTGLANGINSPTNRDRVGRTLIPPFGDFVEGIEPFVSIGRWEGDDFVSRQSYDRSVLATSAAALASLGDTQAVAGPAVLVGILLPALGRARESARMVVSQANLRSLLLAATNYAMENNDEYPPSFDALIEAGFIPEDATAVLESPLGPVWDGQGDYALFAGRGNTFDAEQLVIIDRAMYFDSPDGTVVVGFADGHVEAVPYWRLDELLELPQNEGARDAFMLD